jgi:hypothetical protein
MTPLISPILEAKNSTLKPWFKTGVSVGNLSTTYTEYSGLTQPGRVENRDYLWAIEDGNTGYILAINRNTAALSGVWTVTGMTASDNEDCTSCVVDGVPYLFVCDTGDNANARATIKITRVEEPVITGSNGTISSKVDITCQYPASDIPSHKDVETVLADPDTGDLYFITKRISPVKMYRLPFALSYTGTQTLEFVGNLTSDTAFNVISTTFSSNNGYTTGGNISPNGSEIILRSYSAVYVWRRNKSNETIAQCLARVYDSVLTHSYVGGGGHSSLTTAPKCLHPNQEPQGESVSYDYEGINIYTCSEYLANEGSGASSYPLFKYVRVDKSPTVLELQNGLNSYTGCTDTFIDSSTPTTANGSATSLVADLDFSSYPTISRTRQTLIKYDLSSIPSSATVIGAYMNIYINTEGKMIAFHKMLTSWDGSSTYNSLSAGVGLDNVDAVSTPEAAIGVATASQGIDGYVGSIRVNLDPSTIQGWVSGGANHGYVIVNQLADSSGDGVQLSSSEAATQSQRPKLTISYISA